MTQTKQTPSEQGFNIKTPHHSTKKNSKWNKEIKLTKVKSFVLPASKLTALSQKKVSV